LLRLAARLDEAEADFERALASRLTCDPTTALRAQAM
jgi:hypothetical protein